MATQEQIAKLRDLIDDVKVAMLTTVDHEGCLRSRPMATIETEFSGDLWFFTKEHSPKAGELMRDGHVCVSYADADKQQYVSVSGVGEITRDRAKMEELWNDIMKAWFPDWLDDPEIALLKVHVTNAEYWDAPSSKVVQLFGMAKAVASGEEYRPGEHEKLELDKPYVS